MRQGGQREPGKIQAVAQVVERFADELEADLQRYYQVDLLDLYRPKSGLSYRKMSVFISFLPPESATATAIRNAAVDSGESQDGPSPDPSKESWSQGTMLIASLIDEVRWLRHEFRGANSNTPGPPPSQVERPGVGGKKRRKKMSMQDRMKLDPRMRGERGN